MQGSANRLLIIASHRISQQPLYTRNSTKAFSSLHCYSQPFANQSKQLHTIASYPIGKQQCLKAHSKSSTLASSFSTSSSKMSVQAINSYDDFKQIIAQDKVVAIDFWATWCGPCKMISPIFEKFASEASQDKIAFYKVDVDEQEQISQEVGISAMPTFVFFKKGQKLTQVVGAVPQQLQAAIQKSQE